MPSDAVRDKSSGPERSMADPDFPMTAAHGGPPSSCPSPSFYDSKQRAWYWKGHVDPCPVSALGFRSGRYHFVTAAGECRSFSAGQLVSQSGLLDLFAGDVGWLLRHFGGRGREAEQRIRKLQKKRCGAMLIKACIAAGCVDGGEPTLGAVRGVRAGGDA